MCHTQDLENQGVTTAAGEVAGRSEERRSLLAEHISYSGGGFSSSAML